MVDEEAIASLIAVVKSHCPRLGPALFPQTLRSAVDGGLASLCSDDKQAQRLLKRWSALHRDSDADPKRAIFRTEVDFGRREVRIVGVDAARDEIDYMLGSLERTMELQVIGDATKVSMALSRFLEVNGHSNGEATAAERYRFNEAYQVAYTIKVLISNMPMKVLWGRKGSVQVPFDSHVENFDEVVASVLSATTHSDSDSDSDNDSEGEGGGGMAVVQQSGKKKRKKRRGGQGQKANKKS